MTQASVVGPGLMYPAFGVAEDVTNTTAGNMDAANEAVAFIGHIHITGRPATAKTISSSGGKIHFRTGTVTWAAANTTLRVGIQDVSTTAGPDVEPDGTDDVFDDLVQGTDALSSNATKTATMSSGTKDITHGDLIAVVFTLTTRNGADQVVVQAGTGPSGLNRPLITALTASWTANTLRPMVVIEFDDGTLGFIRGALPPLSASTEGWQESTNPDERGMIFQVPWDCKVEGYWFMATAANANFSGTIQLYSDPTGTPASVSGSDIALLGEQFNGAGIGMTYVSLPEEISLTRDTDYCLAIKSSGTSNITMRPWTLDAAHRICFSGGTTISKGTRNNDAGAFTADTTVIYLMGVMISSLEDTAGAGGASARAQLHIGGI